MLSEVHHGKVTLLPVGIILDAQLSRVQEWWPGVSIIDAAVMPDHLHLLLEFSEEAKVTLPRVVCRLKGLVSREARRAGLVAGDALWQRGFHDRVIRNPAHLDHIRRYIRDNARVWTNRRG